MNKRIRLAALTVFAISVCAGIGGAMLTLAMIQIVMR